ncbi:HAD-IA family hydrolase [Cobetia sp. 5-11-6-3]|uniref:HAD-IA family hydrolase n=1 Tax=Cobetia sp. 5-11-6-3 TaxID=2737458 RepID=UPI001596D4FC|nr:HAD-IA family hydrolase [Cobetia sp. 5-11-6-3]
MTDASAVLPSLRYRLVIFDWDGTLMDSEARIVDCLQAASLAVGMGELPAHAARDIIGLGLPEAMARLFPGASAAQCEALVEAYKQHFVAVDTTPLDFFPGVENGIERLRAHPEQLLAVATGKSRRGLDRMFQAHDCGDWFHASRTADMTLSKPHPLMLEELLAELNVEAHEALMVGDTEYDLEMARALGMHSVGVTYGVHSVPRLEACAPQRIVSHFDELMEWLGAVR